MPPSSNQPSSGGAAPSGGCGCPPMAGRALPALLVALGLVALGWWLWAGLTSIADRGRQVSVRGLAEREVMANKVTWPLVVKTMGQDIQDVYGRVEATNRLVRGFLTDNGIPATEIAMGAPQVFDKDAQTYKSDAAYRYTVTQVITVTSQKVAQVNALILRQGELLKMGVAPSSSDYEYRTTYEFTDLNKIKPAMIAEATKNARSAAQRFADDSGSSLGRILTATQGQFTIDDRDSYTPWIKNVRVVTSVSYELED